MSLQQRTYTAVAEPCRNFNILNWFVIVDPMDGREKMVLSNFAGGSTGNLIFIDPETGEGESVELPGDSGAWGLLHLEKQGKLLAGTCPTYGYLHSLDLKTRTWAEPLRDPNEKYFWGLTLGSDGMVYGGTWPGCSLLRYDPERHLLENVGRVSDNPKNQYSRPVNGGAPGYIIVAGGYDKPFLKAWNIVTETFQEFGTPGASIREVNDRFICTEWNGDLQFYSASTLQPIQDETLKEELTDSSIMLPGGNKSRAVRLKSGKWAGVRGQEFFIWDPVEPQPVLKRIPVEAPPTQIHGLTSDSAGIIWGSTVFGQTIFRYDPQDGTYWNSSNVCNHGGEVYGLQFVDEKLYMSAYVGGDHVVYDPAQPWDQLNNVNPKTLRSVGPELIRPTGRTILGPDGGVWTGWGAKYGTYGGGLSRIDPGTLDVLDWYDPIPGQQLSGLSADDRYLYFATNGEASGLGYNEEVECHFAVWAPEGRLVHAHKFDKGVKLGSVLAIGGRVLVSSGNDIRVFDPESLAFTATIEVGQWIGWIVAAGEGKAYVFGRTDLFLVNARDCSIDRISPLPGPVGAAAVTKEGELYFSHGKVLYRLEG